MNTVHELDDGRYSQPPMAGLDYKIVQSVRRPVLERDGFSKIVKFWLTNWTYHVYVGRRNTISELPKSVFANPFLISQMPHCDEDEVRFWVLLLYYFYLIYDDRLLSKLKGLRGKILGCWCKNTWKSEMPLMADYRFRFYCHAEILKYVLDLFEHPDGKYFWRITWSHWNDDNLTEDMKMFLKNKNMFKQRHGEIYDNFVHLSYMFDDEKWGSKACLKDKEDKCLCYDCRKEVYLNGTVNSDDELYDDHDHSRVNLTIAMAIPVSRLGDFMERLRGGNVPFHEMANAAMNYEIEMMNQYQ